MKTTTSRATSPARTPVMRISMTALAISIAVAIGTFAEPVYAQEAPVQISIPEQPLSKALLQLGEQTSLQIFYSQETVNGYTAPAISGNLSPEEALRRLLAGTGIEFRRTGKNVSLSRPATPEQPAQLAPIQVTGSYNGQLTEGTGSYASSEVSLAKGQSLREIPQSVSVVTRQQIEDQGLADVNEVMQQVPGVTVQGDYFYANSGVYYTRGFKLTNVQVDGVADTTIDSMVLGGNGISNLAMYDHIEVLRGADGLYSGVGSSSGTLNLVRKRPKDEFHGRAAVSAGSWDNYGAELDLTGPLAADGRVRGRLVATVQDRKYFYDYSKSATNFFYGIVEADLTRDTLLTVGGSREKSYGVPEGAGFPTFTTGEFLGFSRSKNWMSPWSEFDKEKTNFFVNLRHQINDRWKIEGGVNATSYDNYLLFNRLVQPIDPSTMLARRYIEAQLDAKSRSTSYDLHLNGKGIIWSLPYDVLIGMDYRRTRYGSASDGTYYELGSNIYDVNFESFSKPSIESEWGGWNKQEQKSLYTRLKLDLSDQIHLVLGGRYTDYKNPTGDYSESGILTPYGGLVYDFLPDWSVYGSIAKIYQSQANYRTGPVDGGSSLDPLEGRSYELGVKGELLGGNITTSAAIYRLERLGEAVSDPDYAGVVDKPTGCCYLNQGKVVSQGIELGMQGEVLPNLMLSASYTYNHSKDRVANTSYATLTSPKHLFKLWGKYQLSGDWSRVAVGAGVNIQSEITAAGTNSASFGGGSYKIRQPGYAIWNAFAEYKINNHWKAALNINNLFDKVYVIPSSTTFGNYYGTPRSFLVTLRGSF